MSDNNKPVEDMLHYPSQWPHVEGRGIEEKILKCPRNTLTESQLCKIIRSTPEDNGGRATLMGWLLLFDVQI